MCAFHTPLGKLPIEGYLLPASVPARIHAVRITTMATPRLRLVGLLLPLAASLAAARADSQQPRPRNVVFILTDDQRYDAIGFQPNAQKWLTTPNIDRLARGGAHLANAFVTTSLCSPSRASILTGQYTHRHGVVDNNRDVPPGTRFFPQYLQTAGYRTAMIGKWHMGQ
jgi:N-acetylglucosamine-6-sulfatase